MGKVLYRKYRSRDLSEIVGQQHITQSLEHALKQNTISHAYLFTGPRGVGKTSIARIFAHEINGLPYADEQSHLDIIEIDAASNRGIEDVRELRDKVHVVPTSAKYKVYIIDEVHMLTTPAFNALLKTLEEPPAHVIFILATTEMHKLPETIVSRTQHFSFKPVAKEQVIAHLRSIADRENMSIDDEALSLVAAYGNGSFRDSISLLDQARNYSTAVTADTIRSIIGIAPEESIQTIMQTIASHNAPELVKVLGALQDQGIEASAIARQLVAYLEQDMLSKSPQMQPQVSLDIMRALIEIAGSRNPDAALKICLLQAAMEPTIAAHVAHAPAQNIAPKVSKSHPAATPVAAQKESGRPAETTLSAQEPVIESQPAVTPKPPIANESSQDEAIATSTDEVTTEEWGAVLMHIKQKYNTLYSVLKTAEIDSQPGKLVLKVSTAFYQKRLNDTKNKTIVIEAIDSVAKRKIVLECILDAASKPTEVVAQAQPQPLATLAQPADVAASPIGAISNIFGGAELLES